MEYISALEASAKWGVSPRQVQRLLAGDRVPGAKKYGRSWMIPAEAEKPINSRMEKKPAEQPLSSDLIDLFAATVIPMPADDPDGILKIMKDDRSRLQYEGELAYLRGDFQRVMRCFQKAKGDEAARLRASLAAVAAAISLGDYRAYTEIESYLKGYTENRENGCLPALVAELALAGVAVCVTAPNMAPNWLKEGDFRDFPPYSYFPYLIYLRAKYFQCTGNYEAMLAAAQTALTFSAPERGITFPGIYLRTACAIACQNLERTNEARRLLLETMHICLPHGFITPFAENVADLGGLTEQCLKQEFPDYFDAIMGQWKRNTKNWISFHNQFTKDNISLILSPREYHLARLVARHVPYEKIAKEHNISVGRLKNIMLEIYEKLYISGRDELANYIMIPKKT